MEKYFNRVRVTWVARNVTNQLTLDNVTKEEAIRRAYFFGWRPPKWWQFWKEKEPTIVEVADN